MMVGMRLVGRRLTGLGSLLLAKEMLLAPLIGEVEVGGSGFLPLFLHTDGGDDQGAVPERIEPELLVAVVSLDFPDFAADLLEKFLRHGETGIFLKELDAHGDRLGALIVQLVEPFTHWFGAIG